jgi:hypothetical protein
VGVSVPHFLLLEGGGAASGDRGVAVGWWSTPSSYVRWWHFPKPSLYLLGSAHEEGDGNGEYSRRFFLVAGLFLSQDVCPVFLTHERSFWRTKTVFSRPQAVLLVEILFIVISNFAIYCFFGVRVFLLSLMPQRLYQIFDSGCFFVWFATIMHLPQFVCLPQFVHLPQPRVWCGLYVADTWGGAPKRSQLWTQSMKNLSIIYMLNEKIHGVTLGTRPVACVLGLEGFYPITCGWVALFN